MLPPDADRPKLALLLDQVAAAVEELLLGGLTTASEATRRTVSVALQEAARFRMLRLGATLRQVADDLGRFTSQDPTLSRRRLTLFLNRTWLLSRGIARALRAGDETTYDRLTIPAPSRPLPEVEVVCLGAVKKVMKAAVVFDFRLRALADADPVRAGQRLSWSFVAPLKPGMDIPPEGFLHLPQKQKFIPADLLNGRTIALRNAAVSADESGGGRLALTDQSTVTVGRPFTDWERFLDWSPAPAAERLGRHVADPLELDTELQEEVVLRDYQIGPPGDGEEPGQLAYPVTAGHLTLRAVVGPAAEGKALRSGLDALRKSRKDQPPLFGLMHYERCRLVLQPLTAFGRDGPDYLTISKENVSKKALLKALSLT